MRRIRGWWAVAAVVLIGAVSPNRANAQSECEQLYTSYMGALAEYQQLNGLAGDWAGTANGIWDQINDLTVPRTAEELGDLNFAFAGAQAWANFYGERAYYTGVSADYLYVAYGLACT